MVIRQLSLLTVVSLSILVVGRGKVQRGKYSDNTTAVKVITTLQKSNRMTLGVEERRNE